MLTQPVSASNDGQPAPRRGAGVSKSAQTVALSGDGKPMR